MKTFKPFLILVFFSIIQFTLAQNVYIPDENFKNRLIELGIDTNTDGEISYEEAEAKTGELNLSTQQITDATGIEAFINITKLNANLNQLSSLDLSENKSLREIYCWGNQLSELIFYPVTNLKIVDCSDNNLNNLNTNNPWKSIRELYCDHNQLTHLSINQPNLQILDCSHNFLEDLYIDASNEDLTGVICNNNNLSSIIIDGKNEIEAIEASYNSITQIELGYSVDELLLNNNLALEMDISGIPFINNLYIENNESLEKMCIRFYPLHYEIHDNGSNAYATEICSVPSGNTLFAGQGIQTFNYQWGLDGDLGDINYDLNNDGIDDLYFRIEVINNGGGDYSSTFFYVTPLNNNLISSDSEYVTQGLFYNDAVYPSQINWMAGEKRYFNRDDYPGGYSWDWYLEDGYFAVLIPEESDTTYCWVKIDWNNEYYYPSGLNGYACWEKCTNTIDLGEDIEAALDDVYILDAGGGFDTYEWNTGETSQLITVDCSVIGEGNHSFNVLAKDGGCYYTDTINVQVVDDIGIDDFQFNQISVGPNPCSDFIAIQNLKKQDLQLEIIDITGSILLRVGIDKKSEKVNVQELPSGIYFCRIYSNNNSSLFKLVKK